jgi:hypothetical protein
VSIDLLKKLILSFRIRQIGQATVKMRIAARSPSFGRNNVSPWHGTLENDFSEYWNLTMLEIIDE